MPRLPILALAALFGTFAASICHADPRVEMTPHAAIWRDGALRMDVDSEASHRVSVRFSWPGIAGRSHWDVPVSALERVMPCSVQHEKFGDSGAADCVDVVPELLAFDRKRREAIVAIAEDDGQNVPLAVLLLQLDAHQVRLIFEDYGSGIDSASLSPDGRYLAYAMGSHAIGTCNEGTFPIVLDIVRKRNVKVSKQSSARPVAVITIGSRWISATRVVFKQVRWNCDDPMHLTDKRTVKFEYDASGGASAHR